MNEFERFKQIMRKLCTEVENQAIENMVYFDAILATGTISLAELKDRVADALVDPKKRTEARQMYSEMWKAVDEAGAGVVVEDLIRNLPPTDRPN